MERLFIALCSCLESRSAVFTRQSTVYITEFDAALWMYIVVTIICVDSIYTLSECKKGIHWSINGTRDHGNGAGGIFVFLKTFVFFRSLALVFQKSPTRNKEATRFTLI